MHNIFFLITLYHTVAVLIELTDPISLNQDIGHGKKGTEKSKKKKFVAIYLLRSS